MLPKMHTKREPRLEWLTSAIRPGVKRRKNASCSKAIHVGGRARGRVAPTGGLEQRALCRDGRTSTPTAPYQASDATEIVALMGYRRPGWRLRGPVRFLSSKGEAGPDRN